MKKKSNYYFTEDHENAIIRYSSSESQKERTELYIKYISPAFDEMVDKIVYTYRFINLPNIATLQEECKIWLTTILDKFDPSKGSKAFSYFSVITKNWFIHKIKESSNKVKKEYHYDDLSKEIKNEYLCTNNEYYARREEYEFWMFLLREINSWEGNNLKENELKIIKAIKILFQNIDEIDIFNKKAVYLYIREITGLNTKQVINNLNKIRFKYRQFKKNWDDNNDLT
jgi:hypothetical protein